MYWRAIPRRVMLGLGKLCRARQLLTCEGVNALKKVAVNIALPAVMFSAFADAEEERADVSSALSALMVVSIALFAVLAAVM